MLHFELDGNLNTFLPLLQTHMKQEFIIRREEFSFQVLVSQKNQMYRIICQPEHNIFTIFFNYVENNVSKQNLFDAQ